MERMTIEEAREQLQVVFRAYPSFEQNLRGLANPKETTTLWAKMLTKGDATFIRTVVTDIASGDFDPVDKFDKWDQLPRNIVREADRRRERVWQKHRTEQYSKAAKSSSGAVAVVGSDKVGKIAVYLGHQVKSREISRSQNNVMLEELLEWEFRGGEKPDWVDDYQDKTPTENVFKMPEINKRESA